jgi:hypothetical protein
VVKADVDFSLAKPGNVVNILKGLRTYTWAVQNPAILKIFDLDWANIINPATDNIC